LIGSREPVAFDVESGAAAAAANGVAMEINASPERLDLSDVNARLAREKGCRFVIDTDAHAVGQLENIRYGVFQARRAGLTRDDVLNSLPYERFREMLRTSRTRRPVAVPVAADAPRAAAAGPSSGSSSKSATTAKAASGARSRASAPPRSGAKPKPAKAVTERPGKTAKRSPKRSSRG
jgi:hypothetical protein